MPISLVLSSTETSMMFIMPMPPTIQMVLALRGVSRLGEIETGNLLAEDGIRVSASMVAESSSMSKRGVSLRSRYVAH
jgi:hypothetical protein